MKTFIVFLRFISIILVLFWIAGYLKIIYPLRFASVPSPLFCFSLAYIGGAIYAYGLASLLNTTTLPIAWVIFTLIVPIITLPILACQKNHADFKHNANKIPGLGCPFYKAGNCQVPNTPASQSLQCSLKRGAYQTDCNVFPILVNKMRN
jgi:hypothetical protein